MIRFRDLNDDTPMTIPDAARYLGALTGTKPHVSTLWRWCLKGCKGVRLESICIGGKRFVTASALERFVQDSTARQTPPPMTTVTITPSAEPHVMRHNRNRRTEIEAARRRLDEMTNVTKPPKSRPRSFNA
jgi:hypothetical protein